MYNILYTILLFNILVIIFKLFGKYRVDNLQALIINYLTAAVCASLYFDKEYHLLQIINSEWIFHAIIIGTLFIIVFNFYAIGIQKIGISISTLTSKISLIIPVTAAFILYPEKNNFNITTGAAITLAIIGIYLSLTKSGKISFDKKYLWLIILIFTGQGFSDLVFNDFAQNYSNGVGYLFFFILFISASISGSIILITRLIKGKAKLQTKSIVWGIIFGIPNFFSLVYFLKALELKESVIVLPIISMGIVISSSIIGSIIYKEEISRNNWIGISFSIFAIYILSL